VTCGDFDGLSVQVTNIAASLSAAADTLPAMDINIWLPPVLAAVIGALLSPSVGKGLLALAEARARRIKHVLVEGAELYASGVPMDEAQFRAAFVAYRAELDALLPPALAPSPTSATRIEPGSGTGITTLTPPPLYRTAMGSGCCRRVSLRQIDPAALAARVAVVRIGSAWTNVVGRSSLDRTVRR